MSTDAVVRAPNGAALRMADTLLRAVGGQTVSLRVPLLAAANDGGQVGQPGATFQDYVLAPVIYRRVRPTMTEGKPAKYELLVAATAVTSLVTTLAAESAQALFDGALGVVDSDGSVKALTAIGTAEVFGAPYLYRLLLRDG
jgi:hypothetical protein